MVACAFLEWPEGLEPKGHQWDAIHRQVANARPDILITNEMPFGSWLASTDRFDEGAALRSIALHEEGVESLKGLGVPAVISSRPVLLGNRLANEAFVIEGQRLKTLHRKQLFPNETGWYEAMWFQGDDSGFIVHDVLGFKIGVLLCTELMFNEHARRYGRAGAELIVVPRATGQPQEQWLTAGAMAALVSGTYVVSSNRVGTLAYSPVFGGRGLAFAPDGALIAETCNSKSLAVVEVDPEISRAQKREYPCYVPEIIR